MVSLEIALEQVELKGLRKILNGLHYGLNKNKANHKIYGDGKSSGNTINSDDKKVYPTTSGERNQVNRVNESD